MKNQYFGDNRDLFKYDLIVRVIKETGLIKHFMFIPMLTENDDTGHGEDRDRKRASAGRDPLVNFLNKFEEKSKRDIKHLESFFGKCNIGMKIYYGKDKYFSHQQRQDYFKQIGDELPSKSLILVDPDNGLEPEGKTKKEHVKYCEIKAIYKHMGKSSILMIFQDLARKSPNSYITQTFKKLNNDLGANQRIYIHDGKTLFFFLTKNKTLQGSLGKVVSDYKRSYNKLHIPNFLG